VPEGEVITHGSRVELRLKLTLADGTLVEETGDEADEIVIGEGNIVPGLEQLLMGHGVGDRIEVEIAAGQGLFGERDNDNIQLIPLIEFEDAPEAGQIREFALPSGQMIPGRVDWVDEYVACIDFNHPLAGRDLIFSATIIDVHNEPAP